MTGLKNLAALALGSQVLVALAQHVTVPTTCGANYTAGTDTVLYTMPYNYNQVMSIIGSYKNLTWSGNPSDTVTLNGTNNQVGTARTYNTAGAHVIETILEYSKPPFPGPYEEVHNTALLTVPSYNLSFYIPYDGTTVTSVCDDKASEFNFTAHYCASNGQAVLAGKVLHMLHLTDAMTAGKFLGGMNFTSCAALNASGPAPVTMPSSTASAMASGMATPSAVPATGSASRYGGSFGVAAVFVAIAGLLA